MSELLRLLFGAAAGIALASLWLGYCAWVDHGEDVRWRERAKSSVDDDVDEDGCDDDDMPWW